jgi:hypothetical protein
MGVPRNLDSEGAIVVVSGSHSYCNGCGEEVSDWGPNRKRHVDVAGYSGRPGEGCQKRFVGKTTDQLHFGPDEVAGVWKNLPFVWLYLRPEANPRLRVTKVGS